MNTSFKNKSEIKTFSDMKAQRIYHEQISNTRNVKGNPSYRSKIIPGRNLSLYKEYQKWKLYG